MASNQLGIKEVLNVNVSEYSATGNGDFVAYFDYATETSLETTAERLDLRGGQGNYKLLSFDHTKENMLKISLPLTDMEFLAFLTGKAMSTGATNVPIREVLTVDGSNEATLSQTPVSGTLKLYLKTNSRDVGTEQTAGTPATTENEYSIATATVTFNATTCPSGTEVVAYYDYSAPATTKTITFTADEFAGYLRLTGDGIVTDQYTGETEVVKFDFKKCKPQNTFTLTMSSTDFTTLEITFDLFSVDVGSDKVYCTMHEMVT
jgi:hypothetical protein